MFQNKTFRKVWKKFWEPILGLGFFQWVIAVFMMLFAINFNVYFLIIIGKGLTALRSRELWTYIGVVVAATGIICANIFSIYGNFGDALRHAFFQMGG